MGDSVERAAKIKRSGVIWAALIAAAAGLIGFGYKHIYNENIINISGVVVNEKGSPIENVNIFLHGEIITRSTSSGQFSLNFPKNKVDPIMISAFREGYLEWKENVSIKNNTTGLTIILRTSGESSRKDKTNLQSTFLFQQGSIDFSKKSNTESDSTHATKDKAGSVPTPPWNERD